MKYIWTQPNGKPYEKEWQVALNFAFRDMTTKQKKEYQSLCQKIDDICRNFNNTICSTCSGNVVHKETVFVDRYPNGEFITDLVRYDTCCRRCASNNGYFSVYDEGTNVNMILRMIANVTKHNKLYGYLDYSKKACSLPREIRSNTCLRFFCSKGEKERKLVQPILLKINKIRSNLWKTLLD